MDKALEQRIICGAEQAIASGFEFSSLWGIRFRNNIAYLTSPIFPLSYFVAGKRRLNVYDIDGVERRMISLYLNISAEEINNFGIGFDFLIDRKSDYLAYNSNEYGYKALWGRFKDSALSKKYLNECTELGFRVGALFLDKKR